MSTGERSFEARVASNMNALNLKEKDTDDTHLQIFSQQIAAVKDELQELFASQAGTLNNQSGKRNGIRKIRPFDGESQSARSFLTAIELQMENDGVVGDERKVMYVGNYLEGKAWNWFEPIARERNQHARENWSERAKRILTNYVEMKKAMQQAFGDRPKQHRNFNVYDRLGR